MTKFPPQAAATDPGGRPQGSLVDPLPMGFVIERDCPYGVPANLKNFPFEVFVRPYPGTVRRAIWGECRGKLYSVVAQHSGDPLEPTEPGVDHMAVCEHMGFLTE